MVNSHPAPYYSPSGKWPLSAILVFLMITIPMGLLWGLGYAHAMMAAPIAFFKFFFAILLIVLVSKIDGWMIVTYGKIRSEKVAFILGLIAVACIMYVHWAVWLDLMMREGEVAGQPFAREYTEQNEKSLFPWLILHPRHVWMYMMHVAEAGYESFGPIRMSDSAIMAVWIFELVFIMGAIPYNFLKPVKRPFCESENQWFEEDELNPMSVVADQADFVEKLEKGDFTAFLSMRRVNKRFEHSLITLYHSTGNEYFVSVTNQRPRPHSGKSDSYDTQEIVHTIRVDARVGQVLKKQIRE